MKYKKNKIKKAFLDEKLVQKIESYNVVNMSNEEFVNYVSAMFLSKFDAEFKEIKELEEKLKVTNTSNS